MGRWMGARHRAQGGAADGGAGTVETAIFGLFGLLIAFTFSGASGRFDHRRDQIVTEANAIGTAYLRIDLLPPEAQPSLRALFREYLGSRIATYQKLPDLEAAKAEYDRSVGLQGEIWTRAVAAARSVENPAVPSLVVPALNDMFDIATARLAATRMHVPLVIVVLLFGLALAAAMVVGYSTSQDQERNWFRTVLFAVVISVSVYVILDLEFPRFGLIRVDAADHLLVELLEQMK
ncbi:MAG TPA: hypothetical protein VFR85_15275 [Anaeromyxobacteraceae bacterium]|nr:hypothetical protein [Anaeromyxobacteraceae bacterium]